MMIRIKYTELFDVEILHDFYNTGKCPDFTIVPTKACEGVLSRYGLIFKSRRTGFTVYTEVTTSGGPELMKKALVSETKFTFLLKLNNPNLLNFSDLPLEQSPDSFYYFNNLTTNISADGKPLLISDTAAKKVGSQDLKKKKGPVYSYHHVSGDALLTGEIRGTDSGEMLSKELDNNNGNFNFSIETVGLAEGRAEFWLAGVKKDSFYLTKNFGKEDFFAILEIFHKDTLPASYLFLNPSGSVISKSYKIKFANRATTWRYIVSNKFGNSFPNPKVEKVSGPAITFTKDASSTTEKIIFFSDTPQFLKEAPVAGIKLIRNIADGSALIPNLPNPKANFVKKEGSTIYSDILITV